ncbi:MAG: hypothetical protein KJO21_03855 [Verrucomicrobiae bacterium]|nr:hypothetical protein [Verrucomicrobiae bacterium]NNJ42634.1 hypothetical protein [Akkermansiaceae bacterium]
MNRKTLDSALDALSLATQTVWDVVKSTLMDAATRIASLVNRKPYPQDRRGPQWQQLELPLSRTPVKRWNR